jgi:hypothetical protein
VNPIVVMMRRELREHSAAGVFAFAAVSLFFLISVALTHPNFRGAASAEQMTSITVSTVEVGASTAFSFFSLTSAVAALLIGRAVVRNDRAGDARAFLLHRPVDATTIFVAKILAASTLYLLAVGIPMTLHEWWLAVPGHRAVPYDIRLALGSIADLTTGLVYVAAGMLMGMRYRASIDRGILAIGLAIACSILAISAHEFWQAELIVAACVAVLTLAAWGAFRAIGGFVSQARSARAALMITTALGVAGAGVIAYALITLFGDTQPDSNPRSTTTSVGSNGELLRVTTAFGALAGMRVVSVTDLAGRPVPVYSDTASRRDLVSGVLTTGELPLVPERWSSVFDEDSYRGSSRVYVPIISRQTVLTPLLWYYLPQHRLIAAYDARNARQVGWLGPDGYHAGLDEPGMRFPGPLRPALRYFPRIPVLAFPHAVYRLDVSQREARQVFATNADEVITGAAASDGSEMLFGTEGLSRARIDSGAQFIAVATKRNVYVRSMTGRALLTIARDPAAASYGSVTVTRATLAPGEPTFVRYGSRFGTLPPPEQHKAPDIVVALAGDSGTSKPAFASGRYTLPRDTYGTPLGRVSVASRIATVATPLVVAIAAQIDNAITGEEPDSPDTPATWALLVFGALLAGAGAFAIGRTYAFPRPRLATWALIAFLCGLGGLVLMLALIDRPARVPCPSCGRKRIVTRERCEHCGAPFAPPAPDGTEIFESSSVTTASVGDTA